MSIEGIQNSFGTTFAHTSAAHGTSGASSVFMGHTVSTVSSPSSLLADAAEELGFAVDRTKEYEIGRRKERQSSEISERLLEKYRVLMEQTGQSEKLNSTVDALKHAKTREDMDRAVREAFKDPTEIWAALESAREAFEADGSVSADQKAVLKSLAAAHMEKNAQAVRLGLQGALASEGFPEVGDAAAAGAFYREAVGEFSDVKEVFQSIRAKYGDDFERAMDFLFSAISADIKSETPSMGRAHLESVHGKLREVRLAQSAYTELSALMTRWRDVHGVKNAALTAMDLLGELIEFRSRAYVSDTAVDQLCAKAHPPDIEREVLFRQDLLAAVRRLPTAFLDAGEGKTSFVDALRTSLDAAIAREDEYLASLE